VTAAEDRDAPHQHVSGPSSNRPTSKFPILVIHILLATQPARAPHARATR